MRNTVDCSAFERMPDLDLIALMGGLYTALSGNDAFQADKWHADSPKLEQLKERHDVLQEAYNAAIYKDIQKIAAKKEARAQSIDILKAIASNVGLSAWNDPAKIAALGFPMKRPRTSNTAPLGATANFVVLQGEHRGQLIGKAKAIAGATFYDVEFTERDPTVEANWTHFDSFPGSSSMVFNELTPAKQYSFRMRGRSSKGAGPWSTPVTIIAT